MSSLQGGPFGQGGGFARPTFVDAAGAGEMSFSGFFNAVYAWMAAGLALTGLVAYWVATHVNGMSLHGGPVVLMFVVEIALVIGISSAIQRINTVVATAMFLLFAVVNGVMLSSVFKVYTSASICSTFLVTAGAFGAMSMYGYVTKRDLTRMGSLLMMGLIGVLIASFVGLLWHNSLLQVGISYLGVLVFVGLTAYDTQQLKDMAVQYSRDGVRASRMAIVGSLRLYLDFINLFLMLLRLMGDRRN